MQGAAGGWLLPLVGAGIGVVAIMVILPEEIGTALGTASYFAWVILVVLWVANGKSLLSVALWAVPAALLTVAWLLGAGGAGFAVAAWNLGVLAISFAPPASDWWGVQVSRIGTWLARLTLSREQREVDVAAERVRHQVWAASHSARKVGPARFQAELASIRTDAEGLSSTSARADELRDALLRLIEGLKDPSITADTPRSHEAGRALEDYWAALHRLRSSSTLYRIMSWRRKDSKEGA